MHSPPATIAPEIIACIAEGRLPTINELRRVAERIRAELRGGQSVFRWERSAPERAERRRMLRAALTALAGDRRAVVERMPAEA
ncbi:hypothetical protein [Sphingomonas sp.]|uniref:hypothetical protein n=1 Tax=Sphingomonas sp. TaxID=28214 RepID=UPI002ED870FD